MAVTRAKAASASPLHPPLEEKRKRRTVKPKAKEPARAPEPQPVQDVRPEEVSTNGNTPSNLDDDREEALELLRLADQKREENLPLTKITVRPVEPSSTAVTPPRVVPQPSSSTPPTNGHALPAATPPTESFLGRIFSSFKSSIFSTPKPARPSTTTNTPTTSSLSTPIAPPVIGEWTMTLSPSPTPAGEPRSNTKVKPPPRERSTFLRKVASSVRDPAEEEQARKWADKVLKQVLQGSSASTGEKRKRLEDGMTYGDLNHINSKPWKTAASSFGLDDELMDHVEDTPDEPAPMWAVLEHLRIEMLEQNKKMDAAQTEQEVNQPAAKKQKTTQQSSQGVTVKPLNQTTTPLNRAGSPFFNSGGRTTSLRDLHPRSALDRGSTPQSNNIFKKSQQRSASQQNSTSTAFPTSFSVPDDSDDEDIANAPAGDTPTANGTATTAPGASATWTQPPPPAPVMTHAELPTSVDPTPSVPSVEGHLVSTPAVDRVEAQRAKALKFTPHKPSNLSHMSKPSPSLRSDAGNESIIADSPAPINFQRAASGTAAPSISQNTEVTNGTSLFQNKSTSNGISLFQANSLSNGTSSSHSKGMVNGASPFQSKSSSSGTFEFKISSTGKGTSHFKSAGPSLALPDFGFELPDAEPLDLPSDLEADLNTYAQSAEFKARVKAMTDAWDDPILEYDDEL